MPSRNQPAKSKAKPLTQEEVLAHNRKIDAAKATAGKAKKEFISQTVGKATPAGNLPKPAPMFDQKEVASGNAPVPVKKKPPVNSADGFAWFGMRDWYKPEYAKMAPGQVAAALEARKAPSHRLIEQLKATERLANQPAAQVANPVAVKAPAPAPTRKAPTPVRTAPAQTPATERGPSPLAAAVLPAVALSDIRKATEDAISNSALSRLTDRAAGKPVAALPVQSPFRSYGGGTVPHLIIEALAGTGKTTTLVEGLKVVRGLPTKFTPSPQQALIWDAMGRSRGARSICFCAFNVSIKEELSKRMPEGCQAKTLHGLGFGAIAKALGRDAKITVNEHGERVCDFIAEIMDKPFKELRKDRPEFISGLRRLVSLCKMTLTGPQHGSDAETPEQFEESLHGLCGLYDVEVNPEEWEESVKLVPQVLEKCAQLSSTIDFDDMPWLPVVLNLPVWRNDLLLVDEAQDLNRCQQALAMKAGSRLILCGDVNQAIYLFAGADSESIPRMYGLLNETQAGCERLPLTVTRRCGRAIVEQARTIVPTFEAHETNCEGKINRAPFDGLVRCDHCAGFGKSFDIPCDYCEGRGTVKQEMPGGGYRGLAQDGDFILCRTTAPLVGQCLRFLKEGRKATVRGRDIGQGLLNFIDKLEADTVPQLIEGLHGWYDIEMKKLEAEKHPSESKRIMIEDRRDLILTFCEDVRTVAQVRERIEKIFSDATTAGVQLSTVHRSKGLEAKRVFIIQPPGASMPHPAAKSPESRKQEYNLKYVAITRAIEELVWVS